MRLFYPCVILGILASNNSFAIDDTDMQITIKTLESMGIDPESIKPNDPPREATCECRGNCGTWIPHGTDERNRVPVPVSPPSFSYKVKDCKVGSFCGYQASCGDITKSPQNVTGTCVSCS